MTEIRGELLQALAFRKRPYDVRSELITMEFSQEEIECCLAEDIPPDENDHETRLWRTIFSNWENAEGKWTEDTLPESRERRNLVIKKLGIEGTGLARSLEASIPLNERKIGPAVISGNEDHEDWVQLSRFHSYGYWNRYRKHLRYSKNWDAESVDSLDKSTTRILNHMIDPACATLIRKKGLVVGYVQSGKTANYSALIAKAIDVGYRMIIVFSGRTDILRNQTQARLDMEVIGWEGLDAGEKEYYRQKSILEKQNYRAKFVKGKIKPPSMPVFRLTKAQKDFNPGSIALKDTGTPCIAVLKKIKGRLEAFSTILGKSEWKNKPVLLIDDEADDASVNTHQTSITITPALISRIMAASDGSQYVGYTATPYANVFIRPDKVEELFPNDFVICLGRPKHYMGALEIFDIGDCEPHSFGNEEAHIRVITETELKSAGEWDSPPQLDKAIDSFMIAGAVKKWRAVNYGGTFKHHTMLINTDRLTEKHDDTAREVEGLLNTLYPGKTVDTRAANRMESLWETDFKPICISYKEPVPDSWGAIASYLNETITRIIGEVIRIVNHKYNEDTPDFDTPRGFWGILVGGSKLSRGYTIEGLTTTYFSRKPGQLDTLVQMARWYGYRKGYRDLVRLFIPEYLKRGKPKSNSTRRRAPKRYHLLEAFRFGAMVEESFRNNLFEYSKTLKPENIPPLVQYEFKDIPHKFTYLKPTAQNKKRHARFRTTYLGGVIRTTTRIGGPKSRIHNVQQLLNCFDTCSAGLIDSPLKFVGMETQNAIIGETTSKHYLSFLKSLRFSDLDEKHCPKVIEEQITALEEMNITPWRLVMFRRQNQPDYVFNLSKYELPKWGRNYRSPTDGMLIYDKPLDPGHKKISAWMAHHHEGELLQSFDEATLAHRSRQAGVSYIVPFSGECNPDDLYFLWCAIYPGGGSAGVYQVTRASTRL